MAGDIRSRLGQLATVSASGSELFIYADTEAVADEAAQAARDLIGHYGLQAEVRLERWHPLLAEWHDDTETVSLPAWELADAEHQRWIAEDRRVSEATGVAQWTVRVTLSSRRDAMQLAEWLSAEGIPVVRRRKSILLGASDEDAAHELAQWAAERAPAAEVRVERTVLPAPPPDFGPLIPL
jgi:hypothetical protein